jgi:hypothetical protein
MTNTTLLLEKRFIVTPDTKNLMHYWYGLITATDTNNLLLVSAALGGPIPKIRTLKNPSAWCQKNPGAEPRQDYLCTPTTDPTSLHGSQVATPRSLIG